MRSIVAASAVLSLALGLGVNLAVLTVAHSVVIRPLALPSPGELAWVSVVLPDGTPGATLSPADYVDLRDRLRTARLGGFIENRDAFTVGDDGAPEQLRGHQVSAEFFGVLAIEPVLGRLFGKDDEKPRAAVVLSEGLWKRRYAADPGVLGRKIRLNGRSHMIVGVAPDGIVTKLSGSVDLWVPTSLDRIGPQAREWSFVRPIARLLPGRSLPELQAEVQVIAAQLAAAYPDTDKGRSLQVAPLQQQITGTAPRILLLLVIAAILVLLVSCANVTSLLLAHQEARHADTTVRMALGARPLHILLLQVRRALGIASLGLIAAAAFGAILLVALRGLLAEQLPRASEVAPRLPVLLALCASTLVIAVLTAAAPTLKALQTPIVSLLQLAEHQGRGSTGSRATRRVQVLLVGTQVAVAVALSATASQLSLHMAALQATELGFDGRDTLTVAVTRGTPLEVKDEQQANLSMLNRLRTFQGVEDVAFVSELPLSGQMNQTEIVVSGIGEPKPYLVNYRWASPDYFATMKIPLLRGRPFSVDEALKQTYREHPEVVIVNASLARQLWPGADPLNQTIELDGARRVVVGVVGDIRHNALDAPPGPELYTPTLVLPDLNLVVRTTAPASSVVKILREHNPDLAFGAVRSMEDLASATLGPRRLRRAVLLAFGGLAWLLATIGAVAAVTYGVARRQQELRIRWAIGASRSDLLSHVARELVPTIGVSLVCGTAIATLANLALSRAEIGYAWFSVSSLLLGTLPLVAALALAVLLAAVRSMPSECATLLRQ